MKAEDVEAIDPSTVVCTAEPFLTVEDLKGFASFSEGGIKLICTYTTSRYFRCEIALFRAEYPDFLKNIPELSQLVRAGISRLAFVIDERGSRYFGHAIKDVMFCDYSTTLAIGCVFALLEHLRSGDIPLEVISAL
jgi:hypothetical protein